METREYVITLKNFDDLEVFYRDMEEPGGNLYIPDRSVPVYKRRPISRNTHYLLTTEEAESISRDPRVVAVQPSFKELGVQIGRFWTDYSTQFDKSSTYTNGMKNWGILRCLQGFQTPGWGVGGSITSNTGTVTLTSTGKNVDVLIVDGHIDPSHPEFAKNPDGSGGTRVVQFDWFSISQSVTGTSVGKQYDYTPYIDPACPDYDNDGVSDLQADNDHGMHVAGIAAGNTFGWARDANIYNISPYASNLSFLNPELYADQIFDYIRYWHKNKSINPITKVQNPTVCNNSWGAGISTVILGLNSVRYRGTTYQRAGSGLGQFSTIFTEALIRSWGLVYSNSKIFIPYVSGVGQFGNYLVGGMAADIIDAMKDGIIFVGAAGNDSDQIFSYSQDVSNGYNDQVVLSNGDTLPYNRGSVSGVGDSICVGAVSQDYLERKATYSNCGSRVDIFAPGTYIASSVKFEPLSSGCASDIRNNSYRIAKFNGTSMAAPQVTGVIACLLENQPRLSQTEVRSYILGLATTNQMTQTTGGYSDPYDLQGAPNKYLFFKNLRPLTGSLNNKLSTGNRPKTGQMWPRPTTFINRL